MWKTTFVENEHLTVESSGLKAELEESELSLAEVNQGKHGAA